MNKFAEMTTFVSVVDARSFSEAARRLGTTKSQVSQRIQQLERRLGRVLPEPHPAAEPHRPRSHLLRTRLPAAGAGAGGSLGARRRRRPARPAALSAPLAFTPRYLAAAGALRRAPSAIAGGRRPTIVSSTLQEPRFDMARAWAGWTTPAWWRGRSPPTATCSAPVPTTWRGMACRSIPEELQAHDGLVYYNREPGGMLCLPVDGEPASFRIRVRMRTDSGHRCSKARRARPGDPAELPGRRCLAGRRAGPAWLLAGRRAGFRGHRKTQRTPRKILVSASSSKRNRRSGRPRAHRAPVAAGLSSEKPNQRFAFRCLSPGRRHSVAPVNRSGYGRTPCTNPKTRRAAPAGADLSPAPRSPWARSAARPAWPAPRRKRPQGLDGGRIDVRSSAPPARSSPGA